MMMSQTFTFKLTNQDRRTLDRLATTEGESASVLIRQMIRKAARERGLLPAPADQRQADADQSQGGRHGN